MFTTYRLGTKGDALGGSLCLGAAGVSIDLQPAGAVMFDSRDVWHLNIEYVSCR